MTGVVIEGLHKSFGRRSEVHAVAGVDLTVERGELVVLLGPSGCGKTTLLRCIAGLEQPTAGRITIGGAVVYDGMAGTSVKPSKRDIGMVFQDFALWPHMTVTRNVEYPLRARHMWTSTDGPNRVKEVLSVVHCAELADRYPAQLSGGQQQRVALSRALVSRPAVMLLDEPLSSLDALLRTELRHELRRIHRSVGFTGVHVTHDQREALELGDRVVVMRAGEIEQQGTPHEIFQSPVSPYVALFLGVRNRIPISVANGRVDGPAGRIEITPPAGHNGPWELMVRQEHLRIEARSAPGGAVMPGLVSLGSGRVLDLGFAGETYQCFVDLAGQTLIVEATKATAAPEIGDVVQVSALSDAMLIYSDGHLVQS